MDVKRHFNQHLNQSRAQELYESRGSRPRLELPVLNSPYGLCGRKATLNLLYRTLVFPPYLKDYMDTRVCSFEASELRSCVKVEVAVLKSPYGLCARKAALNLDIKQN